MEKSPAFGIIQDTKQDPLGNALLDYHNKQCRTDLLVHSSLFDTDTIPVKWLFRSYEEMPAIEKDALTLCTGKTLDIGAGSGIHSLHLQQLGLDTTALEISPLAKQVMQERGVKKVWLQDFFNLSTAEKFDTLLLLMNGIGICGNIAGLQDFFTQAEKLLAPEGKVIFDSSDVSYLYEEDDGSIAINLNDAYYGEIDFQLQYKKIKGPSFNWLYIDFETLSHYAQQYNFTAALVRSDNYYYLAILTKTNK